MLNTRKCYKCNKIKNLEEFHKSKKEPLGRSYSCRDCKNHYSREYAAKHYIPSKNGRIKNSSPRLCEISDCGGKHSAKGYCKKHLVRFNKYGDATITYKSRNKTPEEKLEQRRRYRKNSMKNPSVRLASRLRNRMKKVLRDNMPVNKKTTRANYSENVGCTGPELVSYIESKWLSGMNWDNYGWGQGKWTIDHIRPIKDYIDKGEDPRTSNHYTNLQPMWFEDNMKKGSKLSI